MIDVVETINAATRRVGEAVRDGQECRTVTLLRSYRATVDDLWDACTNPERIPRWFLPVTGELEVDGRYQLEGNAGGTIEACEPPTRFAATWEFGGGVSWIEVRFTPDGDDRARLELAHTAPVDERWEEFGSGAVGIGWDLALLGLGMHVESGGAVVDPAEIQTWSVSPEGVEFMTLSNEGWRDAEIAAGRPEAEAEEAAQRTIAFYTGAGGEEHPGEG